MDFVQNDECCYRGKTVLVTGHTGFKGRWLSAWLDKMGARVVGLSLPPSEKESQTVSQFFGENIVSVYGDIRDSAQIQSVFEEHQPQIVFHLAAQALVRESYADPLTTFSTNVQGTANLLDAARKLPDRCAVVVVTSDKCYENREWVWGYRETDPLGGFDPYSCSKACAELVTAAYRNSYFQSGNVSVATARAGNVIGGGDWAIDRIVPDFVRSVIAGEPITLRSPHAVRPWQHVLEPIRGYLSLAEELWNTGQSFADAWNFGPDIGSHVTVESLVRNLIEQWGAGEVQVGENTVAQLHETNYLALDCRKSHVKLGWNPALRIGETVALTVEWYKTCHGDSSKDRETTDRQIAQYESMVTQAQRGDGRVFENSREAA